MPVIGEIAAFAFDDSNRTMVDLLRKQGWVACEGQSIARTNGPNGLPNLFAVIGKTWGTDDINAFNIPDLRGQFLRGWSHGKNTDPDVSLRKPLLEGGTDEKKVGSAQPSAVGPHNHGIRGAAGFGMVDTHEDMAVVHPSSKQVR